LDLDGDGIATDVKQSKASETSRNTVDILADIFGGGSSPAQSNPKDDIMSLFNTGSTATASNLTQNAPASNPLDSLISTTQLSTSSSTNVMNLFDSTNQVAPAQNIQSGNSLNNLTTPPTSGSIGTNTSSMCHKFN